MAFKTKEVDGFTWEVRGLRTELRGTPVFKKAGDGSIHVRGME